MASVLSKRSSPAHVRAGDRSRRGPPAGSGSGTPSASSFWGANGTSTEPGPDRDQPLTPPRRGGEPNRTCESDPRHSRAPFSRARACRPADTHPAVKRRGAQGGVFSARGFSLRLPKAPGGKPKSRQEGPGRPGDAEGRSALRGRRGPCSSALVQRIEKTTRTRTFAHGRAVSGGAGTFHG